MKAMFFSIVMTTSTGAPENMIPYVVLKVNKALIKERVALVKKLTSTKKETWAKPASLSFWSDDTVEVEWLKALPKDWLSDSETTTLEDQGILYTKKVLDFGDPTLDVARVDATMTVFWDATFNVEGIDKYSDDRYEGGGTVFYKDVLEKAEPLRRRRKDPNA